MTANTDQHGLPSPVASANSPAPSNASTFAGRSSLPTARKQPLKPGAPKEIALINYIDDKVLRITRRYGKKFTESESARDDAPGYTTLDQAIDDIEPLIDLAWASGTPTIQIPYLLSFAGLIMSYTPAFPFSATMFRTIKKLDTAFASLLQGTSGEAIKLHPVSTTEKVRVKSIVEETRLQAVHAASSSGLSTEVDETSDDESDNEAMDIDEDDYNLPTAMAISRIYKLTMEILGDSLAQ